MERNEKALRAFGQRLTQLREERQLSIPELAGRAGLDATHLGRIEAGEVNLLVSTVFKLAKGLGVSPAELL
jgi:transcriptional regulator with XRE-family HTH domain